MKHIGFTILLYLLIISCDSRPVANVVIIDKNGLEKTITANDEKVKVINFWATWCAPCVEELPYFENLSKNHQQKIEVILITLDEAKNVKDIVQPFINENQIKSKVELLDDPYAATWIPMVDQHWDGAIPVTLIVSKDKKQFYNKALSEEELMDAVNEFL